MSRVLASATVNRHRHASKIVLIYNSRFRWRHAEIAEDGPDVDSFDADSFLSTESRRHAFCFWVHCHFIPINSN
jgi:L-amino acid N-acyltransferase YncA